MRDALTFLGLLGGALIALAFLENDALPKCPNVIPDWMNAGTDA